MRTSVPLAVDRVRPSFYSLALFVPLIAGLLSSSACGDDRKGEVIYRQQCADCHGAKGEGTEDSYPEPLVGVRSLKELTRFIIKTMPDGEPEACVGEEAQKVAAYIYDAFYSDIAQARNAPAKIEFSRLTVRQYENAVADLLGSFSGPGEWDDERGLEAEYYHSRRFRRRNRAFERRDATIDFDFGTERPGSEEADSKQPEKKEDSDDDDDDEPPNQFSVRWEGAVMAPETGDYEFVLDTENGARLWINDRETALIDAWVKSGDEMEYRGRIRLLGGRVYPLRVEFFRYNEETASIRLKWKPPHGAMEVIPERLLSPHRWTPTFVVTTPFPPDDRSTGYERGTSISQEWDAATTSAALEVAAFVADNLRRFVDRRRRDDEYEQRVREFCGQLVERAFRRPLSEDERQLFVDRQFEEADNVKTAVKRVVILALKSPRFLYREAGLGPMDAFDTASWLSFALWDSLPDQRLLEAAQKGELETHEQIAAQAERMIADLRTRSKLREFFHQWLKVDRFTEISKDEETFPDFNEAMASDLRASLDLSVDEVVWSDPSDFRELFLADSLYLNGRLAGYYGIDLPAEAPFQKVSFEPQRRAGVLTHPYLLSGFAYDETSSPIHRGVFIARNLLGRRLRPPPQAQTPFAPSLHPDLTTRERVKLQTSPAACQRCHGMINSLGFSLEHFDAVGRYRDEEKDQAIDASGAYSTRDGEDITFAGARALADFLATSEEAQEAFVEQTFQYMIKQPVRAFGENELDRLRNVFAERGFSIRQLMAEMAASSAMTARRLPPSADERQASR